MFRYLFSFFSIILVFNASVNAQKSVQFSSAEILHEMKKLNVLGKVLYMAAHPDDENTRLLAYMSKSRQYRTGYMSMTRGDGGQNLIGDEQGIELGLIRTQELLAARRVDGAEQFFSRAYDFGFSKRTDEALSVWNKEKILADAVWVIRNFKPDIIITRFPEDARAGHGHHSASAVIAHEAFRAAADPNRFKEQFKFGVEPWQAKRILWNTFSFGNINTTSNDQLKIDVGDYIPLIGKSIGEIAAESRSNHRSQGFGSAATRGSAYEYFLHVEGEKATNDPMEGIETSWSKIDGGMKILKDVEKMVSSYDMNKPSQSLQSLLELRSKINSLKDPYWRAQKIKEIDRLIQMVSGLYLEAVASKQYYSPGDSLQLSLMINNRNGVEAKLKNISLLDLNEKFELVLGTNKNLNTNLTAKIPVEFEVSQPYWLKKSIEGGSFNVNDQMMIGKSENDPAFTVKIKIEFSDQLIEWLVPVKFRVVDPAIGEFLQPVFVGPSKTLDAMPQPILSSFNSQQSFKNHDRESKDLIQVKRQINYEHIPTLLYFEPGNQMKINVDLKISGKHIGYIEGAGDKIPAMLKLMGYEVSMLKKQDIIPERLAGFDAIITGVRAYNVNEWLFEKNDILMNYVRNGGNFVVQYNTNSNAGPMKNKVGPRPFTISRNCVTEEDADVNFLDQNDPIMNFPNKISQKDFEGWIQERGIYFAEDFANEYKPLLSMHDQGENDMNGSLIVRREGKGQFIYTGLVFFRELPAGIPGAFRLFANIIANPNNK